jgi:hypothetical protein
MITTFHIHTQEVASKEQIIENIPLETRTLEEYLN